MELWYRALYTSMWERTFRQKYFGIDGKDRVPGHDLRQVTPFFLPSYSINLSIECKNLLSRILVADATQQADLREVMNHPWITKGYGGPPENYLPSRRPLTLPLDFQVFGAMTGFDLGPPEVIEEQLIRTIQSEEYQRAVYALSEKDLAPEPQPFNGPKKRRMFDFFRNTTVVNDKGLPENPLDYFSPLISLYYLVREKQDRDRLRAAQIPSTSP